MQIVYMKFLSLFSRKKKKSRRQSAWNAKPKFFLVYSENALKFLAHLSYAQDEL